MFVALRECGAATRVLPEVDRLFGVPQPAAHHPEIDTGVHVMMVIDYAAAQNFALEVRFAALTHDLGKGVTPREQWPRHIGHEQKSIELVRQLCERIRVPGECRDLALLAARDHGNIHRALELRHATLLDLLERSDALRRPQRFEQLLQACEADYRGRAGFEKRAYPQAERLRAALAAVAAVDAGAIAHACDESAKIPVKIREARLAAIRAALPANTHNKES
jgi:tRNA nucleotidyltransferase (CCA-adding enzyme)